VKMWSGQLPKSAVYRHAGETHAVVIALNIISRAWRVLSGRARRAVWVREVGPVTPARWLHTPLPRWTAWSSAGKMRGAYK
jgi:hypothetical protein